MNTLSIRLSESLHQQLRQLSKKDKVSINQFIVSAISEKTAAFLTRDYLIQRGEQASREKFLNALAKVADIEAEPYDKL